MRLRRSALTELHGTSGRSPATLTVIVRIVSDSTAPGRAVAKAGLYRATRSGESIGPRTAYRTRRSGLLAARAPHLPYPPDELLAPRTPLKHLNSNIVTRRAGSQRGYARMINSGLSLLDGAWGQSPLSLGAH